MSKTDKIKLDTVAAGAGMTQAFISLYRTDVKDLAGAGAWVDIPFNIEAEPKKNITHDHESDSEEVILPAGTYKFSYEANFYAAGAWPDGVLRLLDDGVEIPGSYKQGSGGYPSYAGLCAGTKIAFVGADSVIKMQAGARQNIDVAGKNNTNPDPTTMTVASLNILKISDDTS